MNNKSNRTNFLRISSTDCPPILTAFELEKFISLNFGCFVEIACAVSTYSDTFGHDVDVVECGIFCPYHHIVHFCSSCKKKLDDFYKASIEKIQCRISTEEFLELERQNEQEIFEQQLAGIGGHI